MKYIFFTIIYFTAFLGFSQRPIQDKASLAQEKRQVYEKWGEWRPYANRFLGIPTNPAYYTVWTFSSKNRAYKGGSDIRPFKAGGLGSTNAFMTTSLENNAEDISEQTDIIDKENEQEFLHVTNLTSKADVLYNVYYKLRFKIFEDITSINNFETYFFKSSSELLKRYSLETYYEKFTILKDKLDASHKAVVSRGKRYLIYHQIMLDLRKLIKEMEAVNSFQIKLIKAKKKMNTTLIKKRIDTTLSDRKIFMNLILNNPDFY